MPIMKRLSIIAVLTVLLTVIQTPRSVAQVDWSKINDVFRILSAGPSSADGCVIELEKCAADRKRFVKNNHAEVISLLKSSSMRGCSDSLWKVVEARVSFLVPFAKVFEGDELLGVNEVSKENISKIIRQFGSRERLTYYADILKSSAEAFDSYVKLSLELADAALAAKCYDLADENYRDVIRFGEIDPTFTRRAQIGIDDIRATRR
jgi:hypothetical protein